MLHYHYKIKKHVFIFLFKIYVWDIINFISINKIRIIEIVNGVGNFILMIT